MGSAETVAADTQPDPYAELREIIWVNSRGIVDKPEEIVIQEARGPGFVHFEVQCADSDVGALIGQRGKYADAIRMLVEVAGSVRKIRVSLRIMPRDGDGTSRR